MQVADQVASARAAPVSGNNGSNKWPAALSCAGVVVATSLLFAWQATRTLRRCGAMDDDEEVFSGVLWGLSPLISAYLYCWTIALSLAPRAKVGGGAVPTRAACLLLLAVAADKLIAPVAGAAALVLAPLLTACACGRAMADRLQRAGAEPWSAATAAATPTYQSRAEEREQRERRASAVFALKLAATVPVFVCFMAWIAPPEAKLPDAPTTDAVFFLAGPLFVTARVVLPFMAGSPVLGVLAAVDNMRALAAIIGGIGWLVAAALAGSFFGTIAGTVVVWMGELGMVGTLGYFLAVEEHYKELMINKRKEPRRAKDASGLLDGRDSGDACSAHIDAAADAAAAGGGGPCLDCVLRRCWL